MEGYVEKNALEKALSLGAAADRENRRRAWVRAICILHDIPAADVAPVIHARWVEVCDEVQDILGEREPYLVVRGYRCSRCKRFEKKPEPYCNCGAKMDMD